MKVRKPIMTEFPKRLRNNPLFVTYIQEEKIAVYEAAIKRYSNGVYLDQDSYGTALMRATEKKDLSDFWKVFDKINNEGIKMYKWQSLTMGNEEGI